MKVVFYALTDEDLFLNRLPVARHLRDVGYEVGFAGPSDGYATKIEQESFEFNRVLDAGRSVVGDVAATLSLFRTFKRIKPDIVHSFGLRAALRSGLAARIMRLSWVVHSISQPPSDYRPPSLLKVALSDAEVTFRHRKDRDTFIARHYVRPEQTHVLRSSGIDLRDIPMTEEPNRTPVAALVSPEAADLEFFGGAARTILSEDIRARFVVIGDAHTPDMRWQLQRWQEEGLIDWWAKRDDLARALSNVHIVCLPAQMSEHERIMASAAGRALVSAAPRERDRVLRAGDSAVILRSNDATQLTQSLRDLLQNSEKRRKMGRRAREIVEAEYSAKCVAREIMAVYERLFEKGRTV